jgi:replicative DNA helicase
MGKTGLGTNIAFNAAHAYNKPNGGGGSVAFFSLEMSADQLATRILSQESHISSDKIRRGELAQTDFPKLIDASRRIAELPLYIDDTPALTVAALRTRARRLKRQKGLDLIVIDYLQLMHSGSKEGRVQEISEISRGLKALAKELNIPVIALSQLSRAVEQRDDKRPMLSDLRESGSIEQDADVVMFIYREEYYLARLEPEGGTEKYAVWQEKNEQCKNQAELIISKQRHGPVGTVKALFEGRFTKFSNLAKQGFE